MNIDDKIIASNKTIKSLETSYYAALNRYKTVNLKDSFISHMTMDKLKQRRNLSGHLSKINCVAWSGDSEKIVSVSTDGNMIVWNALSTYKLHAISVKTEWILTCAYSSTGDFVACGSMDNQCTLFNLRKTTESSSGTVYAKKELQGHSGYVTSCKFMTGNQTIVTASGDSSCIVWDVLTGQSTAKYMDHLSDVLSVSVTNADPNLLLSAGCDKITRLYDIRQPSACSAFVGHTDAINCVQFFPNGLSFGTASDDKSARLFDIRADRELAKYVPQNKEGVTSLSFSKSGRILFTSYEDQQVIAWDVVTAKPLQTLNDHSQRVSCVAVAPDGSALATSSWDHSIKIYA